MERRHQDSTGDLHEGELAMVGRSIRLQSVAAKSLFTARAGATAVLMIMLAIGATATFVPVSISASAELSRSSEYELKAAFLYNFIKFTEWPVEELANKSDPFVIGILGRDPFGAVLNKVIEGETFQNKTIVVRRFPRMDEAAAASEVLFIGSSEESNLPAILRLLDGQPVLTISEIENFAQRGGMIQLKKENNKITFEINVEAAKRARLAMNAQLLRLAKIVKNEPGRF
jgi:hypothetical protein